MQIRNDLLVSLMVIALVAVNINSCASDSGDEVTCPECDNETELLVGQKCVPIAEVEECGPDGHSHGTECHCFSGQEPTEINGKMYCLQQGCAGDTTDAGGSGGVDFDLHACEHLGDTPEEVTAVDSFDKYEEAHVDLEKLASVSLPQSKEGYIHFPGKKTGEYILNIDTEGVVDSFLDSEQKTLQAEKMGENSDCPEDFKEVWHVSVVNDTGSPKPQIIKFKAGDVSSVNILILEE